MDSKAMRDFLNQSAGSKTTNLQGVKDAINQGDLSKVAASMSPEDMAKVQAILSDGDQMKRIMDSPLAKRLLKQLGQ